MAGKLPAFPFYPGDWLRDNVAGCSLAAQGLWLRMMIVMHTSDRYGFLSILGSPMPPAHIAQRCGTPLDDYETLLTELDRAGVPERLPDGTIYSRRMVRDAKAREKARKNGLRGGNPMLKPPLNPPVKANLKMKGGDEDPKGGSGGKNGTGAKSSFAEMREIMEKTQ